MRVFVCTLLAALLLGCGGGQPGGKEQATKESKPKESKPKEKTRTREELKAAVIGKTKDEVLKLLGKPNRTREFRGREQWSYDRISFDPTSEKIDASATVTFDKEGIATGVIFV